MKQKDKAYLNRRALEALGFIVIEFDRRLKAWFGRSPERPSDEQPLPDLIGDPDGTGGCWGQVIVANLLNLMPCGGQWYCMRDNCFVVGTRFGDSPGEAVARWCIEAEKAGLKPKWTVASADCGFIDPLRRTE
jgi:hypothetical protein